MCSLTHAYNNADYDTPWQCVFVWESTSVLHCHGSTPTSGDAREPYLQICRSGCSGWQLSMWVNEISHIEAWARENSLKLNWAKSMELAFCAWEKRNHVQPACKNTERVTSMKVLGIIVNDRLSATDHVSNLLCGLLSALRVLRRGTPPTASPMTGSDQRCSRRTLSRLHTVR